MAWAPPKSFDDDLVDYQPDYTILHRQQEKREICYRPKETYEFLAERQKRNEEIENANSSQSKEISDSLAMMERIQQIAGTKMLGEHATMSDWEDTSTVEQEAIAMMRHFGMMPMLDGSLGTPQPRARKLPQSGVYVIRNGRRCFPLIMNPDCFVPGRKRNYK